MVQSCESVIDFRRLCTYRRRYKRVRNPNLKKSSPPSLTRVETSGSLEDMLTCFEFFLPVVRDNLEFLEDLAYDFVKRQHEQNVVYTEVRYSPHFFAKDPETAYYTVTRGLRRGCKDYRITVNQILCSINFKRFCYIPLI